MVKEKKLNQQIDKVTYFTIFFEFLKLGCTSFGGPIAHIGFFREHFVNKKKLSIFDLVRLVCSNPCKIYNVVNKGQISLGFDADLTVIDMEKKFTIIQKVKTTIAKQIHMTKYITSG